jgi:hypothetical protein
MVALSILSLLLPALALAAPASQSSKDKDNFRGRCTVPSSAFQLPSSFEALKSAPKLVLMGFGVQNYTCNANGTFE